MRLNEAMATTSARALHMLSALSCGAVVSAAALAERLGVAERTIRRDAETLRDLGYDVQPVTGTGGGYRLRPGTRMPPLLFDEDQVVAIAVALQTSPSVLDGIAQSSARALGTVRQVMPERLRPDADAFTITSVPNYWEFPAPPIDAGLVRTVGAAVRLRHVLRADYLHDGDEPERLRLEPHHLIVWAARWYLVAYDLDAASWRAVRLERLRAKAATHLPFGERALPASDPATFVKRSFDRGDALAEWPCQGSAVLDVPAPLAAEFAPGGAVVEYVTDRTSRLRMGAWSWTGLAGLFLTFAADLGDVQPAELRDAFASISARIARIDPSA